jgi:transposase
MDNLACYKVAGVRQAIKAVGATDCCLPPYSPDLNPIEQVFAKRKGPVRSAKKRTVDGLWTLVGKRLDHFPPDECRCYYRHCGYATTC